MECLNGITHCMYHVSPWYKMKALYLTMVFQGGLLPLKDRIFSFPVTSSRFKGSNSSAYGSSSIPLALLPVDDAIASN